MGVDVPTLFDGDVLDEVSNQLLQSRVHVRDAETGRALHQLRGFSSLISSVQYSPDGRSLLVAGGAFDESSHPQGLDRKFGEVVLWEPERGQTSYVLGLLHDPAPDNQPELVGGVYSIAVSTDARYVVADGKGIYGQGRQRAWNVRTGEVVDAKDIKRFSEATFSPDHRFSAIPYQFDDRSEVKVFDGTGAVRHVWTLPERAVTRTRFSADSRFVAACGPGGTFVYDVVNGKFVHQLKDPAAAAADVAFSADGTRLATTSGHNITLWDLDSGEEVFTLRGHEAAVTGLAFSPDDSFLASVDQGGVVRIWEAK
jgi:WD40 repeat protein